MYVMYLHGATSGTRPLQQFGIWLLHAYMLMLYTRDASTHIWQETSYSWNIYRVHICRIFCFLTFFFERFLQIRLWRKPFKKKGPWPRRRDNWRRTYTCFGAEVQGHFLRVVDVAASVAWTWHELSAADLGANCYGAELWKFINSNFYHDLDIEKYSWLRVFMVTCSI
jgi:hypothetical protein